MWSWIDVCVLAVTGLALGWLVYLVFCWVRGREP
jgi:hypothetical protein